MDFYNLLNSACKNEGLTFDHEKYEKFLLYMSLLKEWNEKINLTAITEDEEIIKKHFIDSIKAFRFKELSKSKKLIDIGTGAGFPGIPISIIKPEINVVLLDSLNKRIVFLNDVISKLGLKNITAYHGRAEDFLKENNCRQSFDIVISRAVANLTVLSEFCIPYVKINGYFLAMKGPAVEDEISEAKKAISILGGSLSDILSVNIEDTDLNHNIVVIKKIKNTPSAYPRKAGIVNKKPLI